MESGSYARYGATPGFRCSDLLKLHLLGECPGGSSELWGLWVGGGGAQEAAQRGES